MQRVLVLAVVFGLSAALLQWGCSQAANRTLMVMQYWSSDNEDEEFRIVTSGLPPDAIIKRTSEPKTPDDPNTLLELNSDYKFEIVIRIAKSETAPVPPSQ